MTFNGRPGRPVVVATGATGGTVHVVARDRDDTLIHLREDFFGKLVNHLPGMLAGDPTAVMSSAGTLHVFARGRLGHLLYYRWDRDAQWPRVPNVPHEAFLGALVPTIDRGWRIAYDPVAVAWPDNGVAVYVRGAEDLLLRWSSVDDGVTWTEEARHIGGFVTSDVAVIQRPNNGLELLAADQAGLLRRWGPVPIPSSGQLPTRPEAPDPDSHVTSQLYIDSEHVTSAQIKTQPGVFTLTGDGLCVGRDSGSPVTPDHAAPFTFTGGTIERVIVDVSGGPYIDHEKEVLAYFARD